MQSVIGHADNTLERPVDAHGMGRRRFLKYIAAAAAAMVVGFALSPRPSKGEIMMTPQQPPEEIAPHGKITVYAFATGVSLHAFPGEARCGSD